MNKKIGMTTFHESLSYGATLQCMALQKTLIKMGYRPEFINFQRAKCIDSECAGKQPSIKEKIMASFIWLAQFIQNAFMKSNDVKVKALFEDFKNENLIVSKKEFNSIDELYKTNFDYDIFITGSDQVWNPFSKFLKVYGLGFVNNNKKTIAYAASIGVSKIPEDKKEYLYNCIKNVQHYSCREYEGTAELEDLLDKKVLNVLDPTLLLNKSEWLQYSSNTPIKEKYVLCFFLGSLVYPRKVAEMIAKKHGYKVYVIPGSPRDLFTNGKLMMACGPKEFLNLFSNAEFICTDSFHGTAFAINMNKDFYTFCRRGYEAPTSYISRIRDLVDILGIKDRLIYPDTYVNIEYKNIDYNKVNILLENERKKSLEFLKNALCNS